MTVLLQHLWPALLLAFALGLGFTLTFGSGSNLPSARIEVRVGAALALVTAAVLAALQVVPGRPGLWLDIAVLCAFAYAAGVAGGSLIRLVVGRRRQVVTLEKEPG